MKRCQVWHLAGELTLTAQENGCPIGVPETRNHIKNAVIIAGGHHSGKSLTLNEHLKPTLGIGYYAHKFTLNGQRGFIFSQSFEESLKNFLEHSKRYFGNDLLVFAARPESEHGSKLNSMRNALQMAEFTVTIVAIQEKREAFKKAKEIFDILK